MRPGEAAGMFIAMLLMVLVCGLLALGIVWVYGALADALAAVGV